jgi:glycosyltransferase involved in cell wall biosynthesis
MTFKGKLDVTNMRQIRDIVRTYAIDIVNAQSSYDRYTSILARWLYRLPVKLVHARRQMPRSVGGMLQNALYTQGTDRIVAVSHEIQRALVRRGMQPEHITVIYNGIPPEKYTRPFSWSAIADLRRRYALAPDDVTIGCVSRKKHQEQLLLALQHLDFRATVMFLGIRAEEVDPDILRSVRATHQIIFCGTVAPEQVLDYYALFTLHVLPSTIEGLSQTLLEAMAFGVPVIATRAAGNIDLIQHGWNGYLYENNDPQDLAENIQTLLSSETHAADVIQRARKTATEDYAIDRTITGYEQLFQQLLQPETVRSDTPVIRRAMPASHP